MNYIGIADELYVDIVMRSYRQGVPRTSRIAVPPENIDGQMPLQSGDILF